MPMNGSKAETSSSSDESEGEEQPGAQLGGQCQVPVQARRGRGDRGQAVGGGPAQPTRQSTRTRRANTRLSGYQLLA
ncbi:hypothetical protein GN244_ATG08981 [Phytophthora infestans]|uniref:Uncharacterized protein n=1 Tax=Phytophthora infestans TaxID=4787 RepID=A0A833WVE0_PHYIN|nr:hypothetical protein GN244_ATG08981 [Phytophthora infestans]